MTRVKRMFFFSLISLRYILSLQPHSAMQTASQKVRAYCYACDHQMIAVIRIESSCAVLRIQLERTVANAALKHSTWETPFLVHLVLGKWNMDGIFTECSLFVPTEHRCQRAALRYTFNRQDNTFEEKKIGNQ